MYNEAIGKYSADVQSEDLDDGDVLESSNDEEEVNPEDIRDYKNKNIIRS